MTDNASLQNGSVFEVTQSSYSRKTDNESEQLSAANHAELNTILSKLTFENPISDTLFMGKYQMLLLEDYISWQKPLGELFETSIVICHAKARKVSEKSVRDEVFSEDGSPLPMKFDHFHKRISARSRTYSLVKQLNEKYHLLPLSENIGRQILSICNKIGSESYQNLPVIAICHGKNPKASVLLGSLDQNTSRLILKTEGRVTKQEQLPRISAFKEAHLCGFPSSFTTIDTSVYAHYDFLECDDDQSSEQDQVIDCSITMDCWWSDTLAVLEPLAAECICYAKIQAGSGDKMPEAFLLHKEIQFIEALQKSLQTGLMTWPICDCDLDVMERLQKLINDQKTAVYKRETSSPVSSNSEYFELKKRKNLDFTEKLWTILKDCTCFEELQDSFTFVYNSLGEFFISPYVFQKNMSTIAIDIKRMMERKVKCPVMTPKSAIRLLLEIGVEKIRRDYVTLFLRLVPFESISYFLEPDLLSLDAVTCLKKLYSVLELTIVCVKRLRLSNILLSEFVRSTLKHYTVLDIDLSHIFTFQVPAVKARQLLNPMRPTVWEISFVSKMNDFMKQSVHRYVTTPTHEHIYAPKNYHPKLMLETASYSYLTATLIQSDVFKDK